MDELIRATAAALGTIVLMTLACGGDAPPGNGTPPECVAHPAPVPPEYVEPAGLLTPECEAAECIQRALDLAASTGAPGVGLERGRTYHHDRPLAVHAGLMLGAVGDAALPRPILHAPDTVPHGTLLGEGGVIYHLDLRGPRYGQTHYPVKVHDDWLYTGVNAGGARTWSVIGTSIDGYPSTCLLGVDVDGATVIGSRLAHCGYSGLSLFGDPPTGYCGRDAVVKNTVMEHNGQNGADACARDAVYRGNVFRGNGWDGHGGDMNGIAVFWPQADVGNVIIEDATAEGNYGEGVRVQIGDGSVRVTGLRYTEDRPAWGVEIEGCRVG